MNAIMGLKTVLRTQFYSNIQLMKSSINSLIIFVLHSPPLLEASPESVDVSRERLGRLDVMCKESVTNGDVPGIVALVARKGKIVWRRAEKLSLRFFETLKKSE